MRSECVDGWTRDRRGGWRGEDGGRNRLPKGKMPRLIDELSIARAKSTPRVAKVCTLLTIKAVLFMAH
jgi:hypothetical protein